MKRTLGLSVAVAAALVVVGAGAAQAKHTSAKAIWKEVKHAVVKEAKKDWKVVKEEDQNHPVILNCDSVPLHVCVYENVDLVASYTNSEETLNTDEVGYFWCRTHGTCRVLAATKKCSDVETMTHHPDGVVAGFKELGQHTYQIVKKDKQTDPNSHDTYSFRLVSDDPDYYKKGHPVECP